MTGALEVKEPVQLGPTPLPLDWRPLPEIPAQRYTGAALEALERDHLWGKTWLCVGREEELARPGDFKTFERLGKPLVLVRGKDLEVRAFYNICRHRGARVARGEHGHAGLLRCQFHSWSYKLTGELAGVPGEEGFACLDRADRNLVPVHCKRWGGWLFVNFDAAAAPLSELLGDVPEHLVTTGMESLRIVGKRSYVIESNWKTTTDAFLEAYHLDTIHPQTAAAVNDARFSTIALMSGGHSWQALRKRKLLGDQVTGATDMPEIVGIDRRFQEFGITYTLFPNIIAPVDPVGFPVLLVWPISVDRSEIEVYFLGPEWESPARGAFYENYFDFFDRLMKEDMDNLASIQRSLSSGVLTGPLMGFQEQRAYWLHQAIDEQIGISRIPTELRVASVLHEST